MAAAEEEDAGELLAAEAAGDPAEEAGGEDALLAVSEDDDIPAILAGGGVGEADGAAGAGKEGEVDFTLLDLAEEADALDGDEEVIAGIGEGAVKTAESPNALDGTGT